MRGKRTERSGDREGEQGRVSELFVGVGVMALWAMCLQGARGPSLADHGWREDKICSCKRGGGWGQNRV